jgi:hypothetical protein
MATAIAPATVNKMVGVGSQYAILNVNKNGEYQESHDKRLTHLC